MNTTKTPSQLQAACAAVRAALPEAMWQDEADALTPKLTDWRGRYHGHTDLFARPRTPEDLAQLVSVCAQHGLPITPQGGNTGLVGGGTPMGEVLLSTDRLNRIRRVDKAGGVLVAEAGVTLQAVRDAADAIGMLFPLSLASQGTATIGGLVSTNAGGVGVIRYGMMRDLVLGLEAVLPDGRLWNGLRSVRKDNTGYDIKQLLTGAEGTLGVVTAAALRLFPKPKAVFTAFCGMDTPGQAVDLLARLRDALGDTITAFELIPAIALDLVHDHIPGAADPFDGAYDWQVLVDVSVSAGEEAALTALEIVLGEALERDRLIDAIIAKNQAEADALWAIREAIPEAEKREGVAIKHDVSAPTASLPGFLDEASQAAQTALPGARIIAFGHVGDGNIHFNVMGPDGMDRDALLAHSDAVNHAVYTVVDAHHGSIAAEHGVGILKRDALAARRDPVEMDAMRAVKAALDPKNIMNPRVLFTGD